MASGIARWRNGAGKTEMVAKVIFIAARDINKIIGIIFQVRQNPVRNLRVQPIKNLLFREPPAGKGSAIFKQTDFVAIGSKFVSILIVIFATTGQNS